MTMSENEIKDFTFYTSEMEKGMKDKLFFLKFLDPKMSYNFLDYGCANGKTLEAISNCRKNDYDTFCGFDNLRVMVDLARSQWQGASKKAVFTNKWDERTKRENTVLILSSVLHEIYSYLSKSEIEKFWKKIVFSSDAEYIVIRDMCWSSDMDRKINDEYDKDSLYDYQISSHFIPNFLKNSGVTKKQIDEFEDIWGSITNVKNFLHLLLKYRYVVNWDREVRENYFSVLDMELYNRVLNSNYNVVYVERFQLPIIEKFTKLGFGTNIDDNTHIKIILKKK